MTTEVRFKSLDNFDANWTLAKVHGKACTAGKGRFRDHPSEHGNSCYMLCHCCLKIVDKEPISLWSNSKQLQFLGFGFPLYFIFLKYVILFLMIQCLDYAVINVNWDAQNNYDFCYNGHDHIVGGHHIACTSWLVSLSSLNDTLSHEDIIVRVTSFALQLLALVYIRDILRKTYEYYDQKTISLNDYTFILKNLPSIPNIKSKIHAFLSSRLHAIKQIKKTSNDQSQVSLSSKDPLQQPAAQFFGSKSNIQVHPLKNLQHFQLQQSNKKIMSSFEQQSPTNTHAKVKNSVINKQENHLKNSQANNKSDDKAKNVQHLQHDRVEEIILLNNIEQLYSYEAKKKELIEAKRKCLIRAQKGQDVSQTKRQIDLQLKTTQDHIDGFHSKQKLLLGQDKIECEKAFIICSTQTTCENFIEDISELSAADFAPFFGENCELEAEEAPEPRQIIWMNINRTKKEQRWGQVKGWTATVLLLAVVTVVFYFILNVKSQEVQRAIDLASDPQGSKQALNAAIILTYFVIVAIVLFNKFILAALLHWFTDMQLHQCSSDSEYSFALKYTIGLFFTTAVMTLLVEDISFQNIYTHKFGVVEQQSIMFFMNCFLVCAIWLINPWSLIKSLKQRYYMGKKTLTQHQANEVMEDVHYSMGKRYAQILEVTWFTFLYASLIPGGVILSCLGMIMFYWIDKFNLLRRSAVLQNVSGAMVLKAVTLLQFTLLLRPAGELIFDSQLREGYYVQSIVCLIVGFVYMILPKNIILSYLHQEKFEARHETYKQVKHTFVEDYLTMHPLFSRDLKQRLQEIDINGKPIFFVQTFQKRRTLQRLPTAPFLEVPTRLISQNKKQEQSSVVLQQGLKNQKEDIQKRTKERTATL